MRKKPAHWIEQHRMQMPERGSPAGANFGDFEVPLPSGESLRIIVSDGMQWDHVSVSLEHRCPTWEEMQRIKEVFWTGEEAVVQFHPPARNYVNNRLFCLHMWRPQNSEIPMPPTVCV